MTISLVLNQWTISQLPDACAALPLSLERALHNSILQAMNTIDIKATKPRLMLKSKLLSSAWYQKSILIQVDLDRKDWPILLDPKHLNTRSISLIQTSKALNSGTCNNFYDNKMSLTSTRPIFHKWPSMAEKKNDYQFKLTKERREIQMLFM